MDSNSGEQKIGRYTILSHLDSGGMGDVYKAFDPDFNRTVALKQLPALLSTNELKRKRFKRELQTIANLEHDAIIPVYDTGNDGNIHYFVMKFMAGGTLTTRIEERTLTLNDIKGIFRRIGPALDKAHSRGVFHRDLKPSNILFDEDNKAYISDFGIAKVDDANAKLSATKSVIGTPQYMSPEQCQSQIITPQSDVYSLGIILFEMISGHLPFECSNTLEWMIAHVDKMPFLLEKYRNDIPNELEEIVAKALEKDPQNRFQSVGALVAALEKVSFLSIDGDLNFGKQQKESPITKETVTNAGDEKRPFFTNIPPWLIFTGITVVLGLLILGSRPDFRAGFFPQPTPSSTQTASPTSTSTNTPQPTMTPEAPTAVPPPEGFVNVLKFDPSAIFQIDDGPLQRITSNEQLSVPSTTETLHIESNAGILELQLSDRTRLFLDQNSTIEILEIQSDESELETRIIIESGLVAVINENTAVTVQTPADIRASLYRGLIEVNEENSSTIRITIDCIEQTCTVINSDETGQTLEQGEAVQFNTNGEETATQGARYTLYNGLIAGLVITPTPTPTQTSSPTPTVPPSPTPFGSTAVDIGFSVNQQPIEAIKFGNGPVNLLFIGGIHSGLAPSTVTLAEQLIAYFEDNPQEIPENVTLHIIPDLNPDSPNDIGLRTGRYNANGVDLNRNWDCHHVQDPLVGGDRVPGKGGPEPFSEPETESLNNYIFEIEPAAVVFWMASFPEGAISPGGCWEPTTVSGDLATLYSNATNYVYEADYQAAVGFDINGDVSNYLDSQGFPAIAVLLRDFIEPDFQRNLMAVRSVLQNYQYGYFDETYVPETAVPDEIVFYSNRDDDFEIYIMNTNGTNQRQLTNNTAADRFPRVSPDGRRIVFESDRDGNFEIYIMNRDGSNQRRLTFNEEDDHLPSWAPDGQSIIYNASTPDREKTDLFSVSTTGGEPVQLTNTSQYNEAHPSLSTQGQLLYNRREDSSQFWQLFLANSDGSSPTLLTDDSSPNWSGEWSPDGEKIVFLSGRNSDVISGIYVMNADGSSIQPIVEDFDAWGPAWSADGTQIIYSVDQPDNSSHLYIVDINNPGSPRLIAERGGYPSWAPAISTSGTQALPTPTIPPNPTASSGSSTAGNCVENALNRWQNNIYPEFAGRLGCSTSGEKQLTGVFQIFENGLMVWRGDNNTIYVFYTQGPAINSYQIFPMDNVANVTINNERLKGSIGQLWTINGVVQSQIGAPKDAEMGMSGFVLQEFLRGAIFYFNENLSNTYILLNNPNEFRMIQEK